MVERGMAKDSTPGGRVPGRVIAATTLSALALACAYPPLSIWPLAWAALAPFLWSLSRLRRGRQAFGLGYLFGLLHFGPLIPWIGVTIVRWTGTPWGWLAWIGLTAIEALWFALFALVAFRLGQRSPARLLPISLASAWLVVEWLRTLGRLAMPWALLGYSQLPARPLVQAADLFGVLGLGAVIALANALVLQSVQARSLPRLALAAALPLLLAIYGLLRPIAPADTSVRVALIQPNIASNRTTARDPEDELAASRQLADSVASFRPSMVFWPESSAACDALGDAPTRRLFQSLATATGAFQVVGSSVQASDGTETNSAIAFRPDGSGPGRYDKEQLVPFGEFIPARQLLSPLSSTFRFFGADTVAGRPSPPLECGPARLGILVCFESIFGRLARHRAAGGANLLVSLTNDGWADPSFAPDQHLQMTAMRCVETRRACVAAALTGITAVIQPDGSVRSTAPRRPGVLTGTVGLWSSQTLYTQLGDWPLLPALLLTAWYTLSSRRRANPV